MLNNERVNGFGTESWALLLFWGETFSDRNLHFHGVFMKQYLNAIILTLRLHNDV